MSQIAIHLQNLGKVFGRRKRRVTAVQDVNLDVPAGQVYGFLGPNGAGKTTTIRMIMQLVHPTTGQVWINGRPAGQDQTALQGVGALVEGALFYPFLTARQNLEVLARTGGYDDPARIAQLLAQVQLTPHADRRVKGYSTGMKQRLGLAAALLNDPGIVILDEPTNGLDPAGIQEMRHFIRDLATTQGKTVFLSSHLLGEVEQICDRVAIISQGRMLREGAVNELLATGFALMIEAAPLAQAQMALQERWPVTVNGRWLTVQATREAAPHIIRQLVAQGVDVFQVREQQRSLEAYFLEVTAAAEDADA